MTSLHSFIGSGTEGCQPWGGVALDGQGNLYGTTMYGGAGQDGTVFKISAGGIFSVLHSFTGSGTDGNRPGGNLFLDAQGNIYGTTTTGGAYGNGIVFKISKSGAYSMLHSFSAGEGSSPGDLVVDSSGNLFGVTGRGGTGDDGTIFEFSAAQKFTTLYSFTGASDGKSPFGSIALDVRGNLYGTASQGGTYGSGTIFELSVGGTFAPLYSFTGGADGLSPAGVAIDGQGNLFGTTCGDGIVGCGTVFELSPTGNATPAVAGITPTLGPVAGGTTVIITGTNLTGATAVNFGSMAASGFTVNSATQITATSPASAAGKVDVKVTTAGGTSATSSGDQFTYMVGAKPTVTGIAPTSGSTDGGTSIVITGTNFTGATAVKFGNVSATSFTVNSATRITATSPAEAAGPVDVTVTTLGGASATSSADQFTYSAAPTGGLIFVTNRGTNTIGEFTISGATVNASLVSGLSRPSAIAVSGSNLFVANYDTGTIGEYTTSGATVNASLITGLDHPTGIAISGSNLFVTSYSGGTDNGTIGEYTTSGATVNASLVSGLYDTSAIAVSGLNLFVVSYGGGSIGEYTTSGATVNANLITGLALPWGIAVYGSSLFVTSQTSNTIGEYTTSGAMVNASLISGLNPWNLALSGSDLFVTNGSAGTIGEYAMSGATVNAALISGLPFPEGIAVTAGSTVPTVAGISPTTGSNAGGTLVTITGTNLTGTTAVNFGDAAASSFTVNSPTLITATSPAGAAGTVDVTVTTAGGTSSKSSSDNFTYGSTPAIASISPTSGLTVGGTLVTITGANFTGATAVKFGSTSASSFTVNSATQITATSPAGSDGTVDATVTTATGTSPTSAGDRFTYGATPTSGLTGIFGTWTLSASLLEYAPLNGTASVIVQNTGSQAFSTGQKINIALHAIGTGSTDITLNTLSNQSVSALAAGRSKQFNIHVSIPAGLTADTYSIQADIIPQNNLDQFSADNWVSQNAQGQSESIVTHGSVDLTGVFGFAWSLPPAVVNDSPLRGSVPVIVSNIGNVPLPKGQLVNIELDAQGSTNVTFATLTNQSVSALAAGGSKQFIIPINLRGGLPANTYNIVANISAVGSLTEDTSNNRVSERPISNLSTSIVSASRFVNMSGVFGTTWTLLPAVVNDAPLKGTASVVIQNLGNTALATGQKVNIELAASGSTTIPLASLNGLSVSGLAAGGSRQFSIPVNLLTGLPTDTYSFVATITPTPTLSGASDSLNSQILTTVYGEQESIPSQPLFIGVGAGFGSATLFPAGCVAGSGHAIPIQVVVQNTGNQVWPAGQKIDVDIQANGLPNTIPHKIISGISVSSWAPGASKSFMTTFSFPVGLTNFGRYNLQVNADPSYTMGETSNVAVSGSYAGPFWQTVVTPGFIDLADSVLGGSSLPKSIAPSAELRGTVSLTMKNSGTVPIPAGTSATVEFVMHSTTGGSDTTLEIQSFQTPSAMAVGATQTISGAIDLVGGLSADTYEIQAMLTPDDASNFTTSQYAILANSLGNPLTITVH